jgi:cell division protein FtsB
VSERAYTPRSGGRTTEHSSSARRTPMTSSADRTSGARDARRHPAQAQNRKVSTQKAPTHGTAALKLDPARATEVVGAPRLRVAPPTPISAPRAPFIAVVIALVVAGVLGILLINTKTNENTFRISKLQDQKAALDNQQQQLENQIAGYRSPGNLDAAARRLGLVKADSPAYIRLPDGKIIGVPKPGTGQPAITAQDGAAAGKQVPATTQNGAVGNGAGAGAGR